MKCRSILLVDDESIILLDLEMSAQDAGLNPVCASSVESAMKSLDKELPDVAILDVTLGGGTTCKDIAERLHAEGVPYILHTGDLHRQGEWISTSTAPAVFKPMSADLVVQRALKVHHDATVEN